jgi:hypothetical protein
VQQSPPSPEAVIPGQLAAVILNYLESRPMREVEGMVNGLREARMLIDKPRKGK